MRGQEGQTPNECLRREGRKQGLLGVLAISILDVPTQCHRLGKGSPVAKWEGWGQKGWCCSHSAEGRTQRPSPKLEERLVQDSQLLHIEA